MQKKARPQSVFLCVFLWNCPERRRKPGSNDDDGTSNHVIARRRSRSGNPFFWQLVYVGTACTEYGLPRPLWGLAMTDVVDGLRLGSDFLCHCEGRQARGNLLAPMDGRLPLNETSLRFPGWH